MQVLFKTRYEDDIRLLAKTGEKVRVGLVVAFLLAAPLFLGTYYLGELGLLLVYAIAGIGLMILTWVAAERADPVLLDLETGEPVQQEPPL